MDAFGQLPAGNKVFSPFINSGNGGTIRQGGLMRMTPARLPLSKRRKK
jgi:hypothetical protein